MEGDAAESEEVEEADERWDLLSSEVLSSVSEPESLSSLLSEPSSSSAFCSLFPTSSLPSPFPPEAFRLFRFNPLHPVLPGNPILGAGTFILFFSSSPTLRCRRGDWGEYHHWENLRRRREVGRREGRRVVGESWSEHVTGKYHRSRELCGTLFTHAVGQASIIPHNPNPDPPHPPPPPQTTHHTSHTRSTPLS